MSRGLTDVPMIVVGNKTDLHRRDMASDKFRHDVINKVRQHSRKQLPLLNTFNVKSFDLRRNIMNIKVFCDLQMLQFNSKV